MICFQTDGALTFPTGCRDCSKKGALFATSQAEDYYLYGRMLVRCFLDEVAHGSPWLSKSLDDNVHHSEISKINQAYTHIQMRTVVYDVYLYTSMQRCVYDVYLRMCVQHSWLKHPAVLCGSRKCAEMITQRARLLSIFQNLPDL